MILIADSGSTNTSWSLVDTGNGSVKECQTSGINPLYQDEETIYRILQNELTLAVPGVVNLYFYGAGCISQPVNESVSRVLDRVIHPACSYVNTDLMAAARSLCQNNAGIACILGTGSNSCYYNGQEIARHVSPLGYMLGDEGSGAVIGRKFIADLLKNQLPDYISDLFFSTYALTPHQIIEQVYKKPFPNRFLAQFTKFIHDNLEEPLLSQLVKISFDEFFARNISQYPEARQMPVNFTGSIALYFEPLLQASAKDSGFQPGIITGSPMEGLIQFHLRN